MQGFETAQTLIVLFAEHESKIAGLGRAAATALRVHNELKRRPLITVPAAAQRLGITQPTIQAALGHLEELGIVRESTGRRRGRHYIYTEYLRRLDEGTEPLRN